MAKLKKTRKRKVNYEEDPLKHTQTKLEEGREELSQALGYMNDIKTKVATWQGDTKDFFGDVTDAYSTRVEELEAGGELVPVSKLKAVFTHMLPMLANRPDPTKKRFGSVLNGLVRDAEKIYGGLEAQLNDYDINFEKVDKLNEDLIKDSKTYRDEVEKKDTEKKIIDKELGVLERKLGKLKSPKSRSFLDLKQERLEKKRELETISRERTSAINKYQTAINILESLESFRDEQQTMLSEGRTLHENLQSTVDSLKPLFAQISSSADLVEFQSEALKAYDMLKSTFNPALIAITSVSKGLSKTATARIGEKFIEDKTRDAIQTISREHKEELKERSKVEDAMVKGILKDKKTEPGIIDLEEKEPGSYS